MLKPLYVNVVGALHMSDQKHGNATAVRCAIHMTICIDLMARTHMTITAMQVLYKTIMASENTRAFRCTAALKNYLTDINIHEHCLCVKSAGAFFLCPKFTKIRTFSQNLPREKHPLLWGE
nr:MAG TPA: hypothetical protein [Caudoviricetes sp.]